MTKAEISQLSSTELLQKIEQIFRKCDCNFYMEDGKLWLCYIADHLLITKVQYMLNDWGFKGYRLYFGEIQIDVSFKIIPYVLEVA